MKTRPLILHTECSDGWGGQEIRIMEELRGMRRQGYRTALIAPRHSQIFQRALTEGFAVYPVRFGTKAHLHSWGALFRHIARLRPTVINTHSSDDSWMAGPIARMLGVPLIVRTRHVSTPIGSAFSYRHFPHMVLTTSWAIRNNLIQQGLDEKVIFSVPTGIDTDRFSFSESHRASVRKAYGINPEDILVGNICVLRSWKGLDFIIETAPEMPPAFKFMLVGDGPQNKRLREKVRDMKLDDRVIFTGHQEEVERYFSALDIFFFTSYASEGVPQSLLQAMSVGLPIVVSKTPSVMETLQGTQNFIPIQYGDISSARSALKTASENFLGKDADRSEQRARIAAKYGVAAMIRTICDLYGERGVPVPPVPDPAHAVPR